MVVFFRWLTTSASRVAAFVDHARWVILSLVLAALGVVGVFLTLPAWLNVLLAGVSLVLLLLEVRAHAARLREVQFVPRADAFEDVRRQLEGSARFEWLDVGSGHLVVDRLASAALAAGEITARLATTGYTLPTELRESGVAFRRRRIRGGATYNGRVVGLNTDLGRHDELLARTWQLVPGRYWDHLATDILAMHDVLHAGRQDSRLGRDLFVDRLGALRDFGDSWLLNGVGTSVLAITEDARVVVVRQSNQNESSGGLLAPSGSGSLEPTDFGETTERDLADLAARGALRELTEETGIPAAHVSAHAPLGFGRWLEKAAKPELFTIATIAESSHEARRRPIPVADRPYTLATETLRLRTDVGAWQEDDPTTILEEDLRSACSVPLAVALHLLARAVQDPDNRAGRLVREVLVAYARR